MDKINIINNEALLDIERFGTHYNTSYWTDGTIAYKFKLYKDNSRIEDECFLDIILNDRGRGFKIERSLRKWWFGNTLQDFDYETFCQCIKTLACKLGIKTSELWNSRVTYLEIGGNVKLKREYAFIIPSMVSFPRLQKMTCTNTTTYFKSTNWQIIAYDKIMEMYKHKSANKRIRNKICESLFVLRFEIKLTTPSGTTIRNEVNALYKIRDNWDFLIDYWRETFSKIQYLKFQNPKPATKKEFMTRKELLNYGFAISVKTHGLEFFNNIVNSKFRRNHRSQERKHIIEICKSCKVDGFLQYQKHVFEAVNVKAEKMKRKSNEL